MISRKKPFSGHLNSLRSASDPHLSMLWLFLKIKILNPLHCGVVVDCHDWFCAGVFDDPKMEIDSWYWHCLCFCLQSLVAQQSPWSLWRLLWRLPLWLPWRLPWWLPWRLPLWLPWLFPWRAGRWPAWKVNSLPSPESAWPTWQRKALIVFQNILEGSKQFEMGRGYFKEANQQQLLANIFAHLVVVFQVESTTISRRWDGTWNGEAHCRLPCYVFCIWKLTANWNPKHLSVMLGIQLVQELVTAQWVQKGNRGKKI